MAKGVDKNGVLLAIGDVVDVRGKIEWIDRLTGEVSFRVGGVLSALGIAGTENSVPDPGTVLRLKLGDVLKVP